MKDGEPEGLLEGIEVTVVMQQRVPVDQAERPNEAVYGAASRTREEINVKKRSTGSEKLTRFPCSGELSELALRQVPPLAGLKIP
jgi:hypothetical protein